MHINNTYKPAHSYTNSNTEYGIIGASQDGLRYLKQIASKSLGGPATRRHSLGHTATQRRPHVHQEPHPAPVRTFARSHVQHTLHAQGSTSRPALTVPSNSLPQTYREYLRARPATTSAAAGNNNNNNNRRGETTRPCATPGPREGGRPSARAFTGSRTARVRRSLTCNACPRRSASPPPPAGTIRSSRCWPRSSRALCRRGGP